VPDSSIGAPCAQDAQHAQDAPALLEAVLDASVDALLITNANDVILGVSPAAEQLFGLSAHELEGAPLSRLIERTEDDNPATSFHDLAARDAKRGPCEEVTGRCPDGRLLPLQLSRAWYPVAGEQRAIIVLRDLSEEKRRRAAVQRTETRLRRVFETSGGGIIVVGPDGHLREVNDGYCQMLGYSRDELSNASLAELAHPDDRPEVERTLRALRARAADHQVSQLRYRRRDGETIWCHAHLVAEHDDEGELLFAIGLIQDFTAQCVAEDELRSREAYLGSLFNSARDGMMSVGADGRIVVVNDAALEMFMQSDEELIDLPISAVLRDLEHVGDGRRDQRLRAEGVRGDGSTFPVEVAISEDGDLNVFLYVVHDLSARLKLEAELAHAQKMEAIGTLASGIAHDFNNLLMGISGCTEIAVDALSSDGAVRPYLTEIKNAADSGISITRRLLNFGRRRETEAVDFELNLIVSEMEKMLRRLLGAQIELDVSLGAEGCRVRADPGQIDQVLMNLTLNARDAMANGGRLLLQTRELSEHELARRDLHRPHLALTVSDTGVGMEPDGLEQIFEPFFTTKLAGAGTGLGMATVYSVVKAAGGQIGVTSAPGAGTTVEIMLPLVGAPRRAAPRSVEAPRSAAPVTATVLLVEDEPLVRMAIRYYLEDAGYRVLVASDGRESLACSRAFQGRIDALLSDTVLPNQSGPEVAALISRERPGIRTIFMSAHSAEQLAALGLLPRGTPTLQKPFDREALLGRLRRTLEERA
jgi:PAS domain S-box-containing protein